MLLMLFLLAQLVHMHRRSHLVISDHSKHTHTHSHIHLESLEISCFMCMAIIVMIFSYLINGPDDYSCFFVVVHKSFIWVLISHFVEFCCCCYCCVSVLEELIYQKIGIGCLRGKNQGNETIINKITHILL